MPRTVHSEFPLYIAGVVNVDQYRRLSQHARQRQVTKSELLWILIDQLPDLDRPEPQPTQHTT
jgi:hypothetical protein